MRLRKWLLPIASRVMMPWARRYLRKTRRSRYQDVQVNVPPGVFHPGLYLSTRFMLRHLGKEQLSQKRLWEIGAGSGMVAIWCAKQGAIVTASDISNVAVAAIQANAAMNNVALQVVSADLFTGMPEGKFDWIVINPPYYPRDPQNEQENAFYCGAEFEYFQRFFAEIDRFCTPETQIRMVLSEDCNLAQIAKIGLERRWQMIEVERMRKLGEWNYIFAIRPMRDGK